MGQPRQYDPFRNRALPKSGCCCCDVSIPGTNASIAPSSASYKYHPAPLPYHLFFFFFFCAKASGMSSSALAVYPHLPPTTNVLNSHQRSRLMRSTRKLGAVLGTTPYLLENDISFTMLPLGKTTSSALKRQGSIFTHHQMSSLSIASSSTSTTSSHQPSPSASSIYLPQSVAVGTQNSESFPINPPGLSTPRRGRSGDKPPQLCLRLDTVPLPLADGSPLSPCTPLTPTTPTVPDVAEARRKRMAKLTRHLGENVPVELVLAADSVPKSAAIHPSRRPRTRSQSVQVTRTEAARICDDRPSIGRPAQDWVGEWNRSNIKQVQRELRSLKA